jgi:hypothetical protein
VTVTADAGCAWTAVSNNFWITVTAGASGSGNGSVNYSVGPNIAPGPRTGSITIGGQAFSITQAAAATCSFAISPASQSVPAAGTTGTVTVTATAGCGWTAISTAAWISITSNAAGTGNGSISYAVTANTGASARTGTIAIAGQTFTVNQASTSSCFYSISPTTQSVVAGGGTGTVTVTTSAGCAWTGVSNASWITVTSGASGSGNGSVGYTVAANPTTALRTGTVTIAGQTFTVSQPGTGCSYAISPASQSVAAGGTTGSVAVTSGANCTWTGVSNAGWITVTSGASGSGNGSVGYSVAANTATASRTGTLTIGGQTFTVTQAGVAICSFSISPTSLSAAASGATGTVAVTASAGCGWTAISTATWISITSNAAGTGNGSISYAVAANSTTSPRTGTMSVAGQTFTVQQAASAACTYTISPTIQSVVAGGGGGSVTVTAGAGCAWTAVSNASWITVTSGASGSGNGTVGFSAAANTAQSTRTGTITIAGATFTVNQTGVVCSYSISPATRTIAGAGGTGTVTVTAPAGCTWTTLSNASWITVTSGVIGNGNGSVGYTVAAYAGSTSRTGTMTIGGQTFTVTQTAPTSVPTSVLTSPADGATNVNTAWPFTWTSSTGALAYRLTLGTTLGAVDVLDTGEVQATSYSASNLPGGQRLYARVFTKVTSTTWNSSDSSFTTVNRANFIYPTNNATGVDTTLPFTWTSAAGALAYYLYVGTTLGAKDLVNTGEIQATSYLAPNLPRSQTLYGRIWTKFPTYWDYTDITFTTADYATFLYPTNNLANVNPAQPFRWTSSAAALGYRLTVGTTAGASNLADSGEIAGTSFVVPGLPSNQLLFGRIATRLAAGWQWQDIQFTTVRGAYFLTPTEGSVVGVTCNTIQWTPVADARAYYLYVGTSVGAKNIVDSSETPVTTLNLPTLPANQQIYGRIWTKFATDWTYSDVRFSTGLAILTSPANNATGIGTTGTFQWNAVPGVMKYYLYVGDTPGAKNVINTGEITVTSYPMASLPIGVQLYATLWTKMNGCWVAAPVVTFRP